MSSREVSTSFSEAVCKCALTAQQKRVFDTSEPLAHQFESLPLRLGTAGGAGAGTGADGGLASIGSIAVVGPFAHCGRPDVGARLPIESRKRSYGDCYLHSYHGIPYCTLPR